MNLQEKNLRETFKKHQIDLDDLDSFESLEDTLFLSKLRPSIEDLENAVSDITKDYMKRFAEWLISNGYILQDNGRLFKETQSDLSKDYSFNELIEIFLENEAFHNHELLEK